MTVDVTHDSQISDAVTVTIGKTSDLEIVLVTVTDPDPDPDPEETGDTTSKYVVSQGSVIVTTELSDVFVIVVEPEETTVLVTHTEHLSTTLVTTPEVAAAEVVEYNNGLETVSLVTTTPLELVDTITIYDVSIGSVTVTTDPPSDFVVVIKWVVLMTWDLQFSQGWVKVMVLVVEGPGDTISVKVVVSQGTVTVRVSVPETEVVVVYTVEVTTLVTQDLQFSKTVVWEIEGCTKLLLEGPSREDEVRLEKIEEEVMEESVFEILFAGVIDVVIADCVVGINVLFDNVDNNDEDKWVYVDLDVENPYKYNNDVLIISSTISYILSLSVTNDELESANLSIWSLI